MFQRQNKFLTVYGVPHLEETFTLPSVFSSKGTAPTFIKEDGGTTPAHTPTSMESGTEAATTEASTKTESFGPNTEAGPTP